MLEPLLTAANNEKAPSEAFDLSVGCYQRQSGSDRAFSLRLDRDREPTEETAIHDHLNGCQALDRHSCQPTPPEIWPGFATLCGVLSIGKRPRQPHPRVFVQQRGATDEPCPPRPQWTDELAESRVGAGSSHQEPTQTLVHGKKGSGTHIGREKGDDVSKVFFKEKEDESQETHVQDEAGVDQVDPQVQELDRDLW